LDDPSHDDFELWSPSEDREEQCLFGAQVSLLIEEANEYDA